VAAVVDFNGAVDLESLISERKQVSKGFSDFPRRFGSEREISRGHAVSVRLDVRQARLPPFLLMHGTADQAVPYQQSVNFCAQLKSAGDRCELYTIQDGIHGVIHWEENPAEHAYKAFVVNWLRTTLKFH